MGDWTLFSNHGHVLFHLAAHNDARLRDVAEHVGITERAVQKIVRELQQAGYLSVSRHGRCNRYRIDHRKTLRHPLESHCTIAGLIQVLVQKPESAGADSETTQDAAGTSTKPAPLAESARPKPAEPPAAQPKRPAAKQKKSVEDRTAADEPLEIREQGSLF